tara:strand:- start:8676 stop:9131 length:456 start_codon:yes stop_codon:yes gene_type:complete
MTLKKITIMALLFLIPQLSMAALINEMQTCQGLIEHIDKKLDETGSKYDKGAVKKIRNGLEGYNQYIQRDIVTPGLLKYSGGDQSKAKAMQEQVDAYKKTVAKRYDLTYPQNEIFMNHAMAVNECAKQAVPSGQELEDLKEALNLMVEFAQ